MRAVADDEFSMGKELADEMDFCLGCLACETACPAGVDYASLFETARAEAEQARPGKLRRLIRWITLDQIFLYPRRLRLLGWGLRTYRASGLQGLLRKTHALRLFGPGMVDLEGQSPVVEGPSSDRLIKELEVPVKGVPVRGRVGMLSGCVQSIAFAGVNRATVDVLLANGWEVFTPRMQACCGSIHAHNGAPDLAKRAARDLMAAFSLNELDGVISNAGGCGGHLKRYQHLFPEDANAEVWDAKLKDIHEFLAETGFRTPEASPHAGETRKVTYHESCHLRHGQGIADPPREILRAIPGLELIELAESDFCCGSAGIYRLLQPAESQRQLARKLDNVEATNATILATSNPGCHLQIETGLRKRGREHQLLQPVELLAQSYAAESAKRSPT